MAFVEWLKVKLFNFLYHSFKVKISDLTGVLEAIDKDDDGYVCVAEVIDWIETLKVKL